MTPIRVILLTGYLGAGKTTTLNHLLSLPEIRQQKLALLINEFGRLSIDGQLVQKGRHPQFELNRGSLFCACIKTDFLKTLRTIATDIQPDLLLVEATGVADPCDLEPFFEAAELKGRFAVQSVLCLIDAQNFTKAAAYMAAARNQALHADGLILNKADQVDARELDLLSNVLRELNPHAAQVRVVRGQVPAAFLETIRHTPRAGVETLAPPPDLCAVTVECPGTVSREQLLERLNRLGTHLLRAKGILDFGAGPIQMEFVFDRLTTETQAPPSPTLHKALTVITLSMDRLSILRHFADLNVP